MKKESITKDSTTLESIKADLEKLKANNSIGNALNDAETKISQLKKAIKDAEGKKNAAFISADADAYYRAEEEAKRLQTEYDLLLAKIPTLSSMHQISEDEYQRYLNDVNMIINAQKAEQAAKMINLIDKVLEIAEQNCALCNAEEEIRTLLDVDLMRKDRNTLMYLDATYFGDKIKKRTETLKEYALGWIEEPRD